MIVAVFCATACGLTQSIKEGSNELAQSIFYKTVKTLRLDIVPRSDINQDDNQHALSMVLRVYQLKDRKTFDQSDYQTLLTNDSQVLAQDMLARRELTIRPGANASVTQAMEESTQYVAIIGLFRTPDLALDNWRLVIERSALDADKATGIEIHSNYLDFVVKPTAK
nr:type VI secretion system lipoprotein TssJ [Thorsellia anophelis]